MVVLLHGWEVVVVLYPGHLLVVLVVLVVAPARLGPVVVVEYPDLPRFLLQSCCVQLFCCHRVATVGLLQDCHRVARMRTAA